MLSNDIIYYVLFKYLETSDKIKIISLINLPEQKVINLNLQYHEKLEIMTNLIKLQKIKQYQDYLSFPKPDNLDELIPVYGNQKIVKLINYHWSTYHLNLAIKSNNQEMINYFDNIAYNLKSLDSAVLSGNLKLTRFLIQKGIEFDDQLLLSACLSNNLNMVKMVYLLIKAKIYKLLHLGIKMHNLLDSKIINKAIKKGCQVGSYEIVSWLYANVIQEKFLLENFKLKRDPELIILATKNGSLRLIKWLLSFGISLKSEVLEIALENENLEIFNWLLHQSVPFDFYTIAIAAKKNYFKIVKRLWSKKEIYHYLDENIASLDHLSNIEWKYNLNNPNFLTEKEVWKKLKQTYSNNSQITEIHSIVLVFACYSGNLETVTWLTENKALLSQSAFDYACKGGNLEIVKWLKLIDCPIYYLSAIVYASIYNRLEIVNWLFNEFDHEFRESLNENDGIYKKMINYLIDHNYFEMTKFYYDLSISKRKFLEKIEFNKKFMKWLNLELPEKD